MFLFGKRNLEKAFSFSNLVRKELEETLDAIYESAGAARDLDGKDAITQSLDSVNDCIGKVDSVRTIFSEILGRHGKTSFPQAENSSISEGKSPFSFSFNERNIRRTVEQSGQSLESMKKLHDLVSRSVRSAIRHDDQEKLSQALETISECRDRLSQVNDLLTDINQRLERIELEALYAPPSYFGGE